MQLTAASKHDPYHWTALEPEYAFSASQPLHAISFGTGTIAPARSFVAAIAADLGSTCFLSIFEVRSTSDMDLKIKHLHS